MPNYKKGAYVYHAHHGAGIIVGIQKMEVNEQVQLYYIVELVSGSRLMLPVEQAERICTLRSSQAIGEVLASAPTMMATDYQKRRGEIDKKIKSGDQLQCAEVLRDLVWRDHHARLSSTDRAVMNSLKKRLIDILSVQAELGTQEASRWLEAVLDKMTAPGR